MSIQLKEEILQGEMQRCISVVEFDSRCTEQVAQYWYI